MKEKEMVKGNNKHTILNFLFQAFIISLGFSTFYIDIGFALKPYMFFIIIFLMYFIITKDLKIYKFTKNEKKLFLFFITVACGFFFHPGYSTEIFRYILALGYIFIMYIIVRKAVSILSIQQIEKSISLGGIVISVCTLLYFCLGVVKSGFNFNGNGVSYYGLLLDRNQPRLISLFSDDPNITVFIISMFFFYYLCNIKRKYSKVGLVLTALIIVLTFSRGAYIAILFSLIVLWFKDKNITVKAKLVTLVCIIFGIIIINTFIYNKFDISIMNVVIDRFTALESDGGSGRMELWGNALKTFYKHPIIGIGINATLKYNSEEYGTDHYVHNTYLEVLSENGVIGISLYVIFLVGFYVELRKLIRKNSNSMYLYITYISFVFQLIFLSVLLQEMFYILIAISYRYMIDEKIKE